MEELVKELLKLQIRQTELLGQLIEANTGDDNASLVTDPIRVIPPDVVNNAADGPLQIGDQVRVLNPGRIIFEKETIFTIVKIGNRVTSVSTSGLKIIRAAHHLERIG
jgi:hypothetical protein